MMKYIKPESILIQQPEESLMLSQSDEWGEAKKRQALPDNVEPIGNDLNDFSGLKDMKTYNPWEE